MVHAVLRAEGSAPVVVIATPHELVQMLRHPFSSNVTAHKCPSLMRVHAVFPLIPVLRREARSHEQGSAFLSWVHHPIEFIGGAVSVKICFPQLLFIPVIALSSMWPPGEDATSRPGTTPLKSGFLPMCLAPMVLLQAKVRPCIDLFTHTL